MKNIFSLLLVFCFTVASAQHTILWKITNSNTTHVSYLLGTNHSFGASFVQSFPVIRERLASTELVITEAELDRESTIAYYNARAGSDTFFSVLRKADADQVLDIFKNTRAPIDITKYTPGEIFLRLSALLQRMNSSVINQADTILMDKYIQNLGMMENKKFYYLETESFQLNKLSEMGSVINWKLFKKYTPALLNIYRKEKWRKKLGLGLVDYANLTIDYKFSAACVDQKSKKIQIENDQMMRERNQDWMQKLPELLKTQNCFIAVGLMHLYYQCGLVEQLKAIGYTVEPVPMK